MLSHTLRIILLCRHRGLTVCLEPHQFELVSAGRKTRQKENPGKGKRVNEL